MSGVVLSERQARVRWITINRPERHNALDRETILALKDAVAESGQDDETRVVVLTGAGSAFSSGADLRAGREAQAPADEDILEVGFNAAIRAVWNLPKPVIAAVGGAAAGFGCSLALAADVRLASSAARFSLIFVKRGLTLDGGASYFLPRLAGLQGIEMALTGELVNAEEALRLGLVNRVIPKAEFRPQVADYAERLAKNAPLALAAIKASIHHALGSSLDEVLTREMAEQRRMSRTEDVREGIAAFLEKREPVYKGR
ncbi:MAG: enoyl-CoA hydratase/isomerase family protein [Deltaproteobacteria bacterium]|nr:enoyl-CoA hydratase/isomerase family protein [Deltaproteobacteria bacterium]